MPYQRKLPNAQKHGAFAKALILPGEDQREFEQLHAALVEEWAPIGPTEEDAVLDIAIGMWRKRRVQKFLEAKATAAAFDPDHPAYDEAAALRNFAIILDTVPHRAFEEYTRNLRPDKIKHLQQKVPRSAFPSREKWVEAMKKEITSVLVPTIEQFGQPPNEMLLMQSAAILSDNAFKQELALDERINAMIDRAIKRLIQTKAMKQMLG